MDTDPSMSQSTRTRSVRAATVTRRTDIVSRVLIITVCLSLIFFTQGAQASTTHVDGISDQSMPDWDNGFSNNSFFAGYFQTNWASSGHIQYARYVVQWNVMSGSGEEYTHYREQFIRWVEDAGKMGLVLDVSLTRYVGEGPLSSTEYETKLKEILKEAKVLGHPARYVEGWNEPNGQGAESAVAAAHFTNSAYSACEEEGNGCTVIAGNPVDQPYIKGKQQGAKEYVEEYRKNLNPEPKIWGVHPYYSVEYENLSYYNEFLNGLPSKGSGDQIWFTEIAARNCTVSSNNGEMGQAERAQWLAETLIGKSEHKPEHVFYYEFLLGGNKQPACAETDDALYVHSSDPNAEDAPRPAAGYIWDGKSIAWGYTGAPSSVATPNATLTGSVYPSGKLEAKYHFEYGTTTSYGMDSTEGSSVSGSGGVRVSIPISDLAPGTTYHYRLVAWNAEGVPTYGYDRTFHTQPPPEATTGEATSILETQATLHGSVNPEGLNTTYNFQYGLTSSYGSETAIENAGGGEGSIAAGVTISHLAKASIYHYRIVAVSSAGAVPGAEQTFETGGDEFVFYNGGGLLQESLYADQSWTPTALGAGAISGSAAAVTTAAGEHLNFYNYNGTLQESWESNGNWSYASLGVSIIGNPAVVLSTAGEQFVFFNDGGALEETAYHEGKWGVPASVGHAITGDPVAVMSSTGEQFVFFNDGGSLDEMAWNGKAWNPSVLASSITGDPAVLMSSIGEQFVFFNDGGALEETWYHEGKWQSSPVGHAITGDPVAVMSSTGEQFVFFNDGGSLDEMAWNGKAWNPSVLASSITGDPAVLMSSIGEQFVFFNDGGALEETAYHEGKWWGIPASLEQAITGDPVAVMSSTGEQVIFYDYNGLLQEASHKTEWHYTTLGHGAITSNPAVVLSAAGEPAVFYEYKEALRETWYHEGKWGVPASVGHAITGDPVAVMSSTGEQFVFFNDGGSLDEMAWNGKAWNPSVLASSITGDPAVLMSSIGEQFVFFNDGGALEETAYHEGKWGVPASVGHAITGDPVAVMSSTGEQFVFFNDGGSLDEMAWNGKAWNPSVLASSITGDPAVLMSSIGEQFVFFNDGGALEEATYHEGKWPSVSIEHPITSDPAAMMSPVGEQFVFYNDGGALQESWWNGNLWSYDPTGQAMTGSPTVVLNPLGHTG